MKSNLNTPIVVVDKPKLKKPDLWLAKKQQNAYHIEKFKKETVGKMSVPNWTAICMIGDMHFGNKGVDMSAAEQDATLIGKTKNAYAVLLGDTVDNFVQTKIISAVVNKNTSPNEEHELFEHWLSLLKGQAIVAISGNHEQWSKSLAGVDIFKDIYRDRMIAYAQSKFMLHLKVNKQKYVIKMRHKYRFNSSLNETHCVKQMLRMDGEDFDIGVVGHHHSYATEEFVHNETKRLAIRTGSYKVADTFSREVGFTPADAIMPVVLLSPNKREIIPFSDLERGLDYLNFLIRRNK
jgi:predicted MPP superfamily phosphohydrolase